MWLYTPVISALWEADTNGLHIYKFVSQIWDHFPIFLILGGGVFGAWVPGVELRTSYLPGAYRAA